MSCRVSGIISPVTAKALEREALRLNHRQREALAVRLLESLEPLADEFDKWRLLDVPRSKRFVDAEIKRRIEEAERDPSVLIPHEKVMARARRILRETSARSSARKR